MLLAQIRPAGADRGHSLLCDEPLDAAYARHPYLRLLRAAVLRRGRGPPEGFSRFHGVADSTTSALSHQLGRDGAHIEVNAQGDRPLRRYVHRP